MSIICQSRSHLEDLIGFSMATVSLIAGDGIRVYCYGKHHIEVPACRYYADTNLIYTKEDGKLKVTHNDKQS